MRIFLTESANLISASMKHEATFMPDPDVDVRAMLAALEAQRQALSTEVAAMKGGKRRDEILKTLASIEEQKQHLREQHKQAQV